MRKKLPFVFFCSMLFLLTSCSEVFNTMDKTIIDSTYGTLTTGNQSRAVDTASIKNALVEVTGTGITTDLTTEGSIANGAGNFTIEEIPVGENRIVTVYAKDSANTSLVGYVMRAVTDIVSGNNSVAVNWDTTAYANVLYTLNADGTDIFALTDTQEASITAAIDTSVHATLIDTDAIAADFENDSLSAASNYVLVGGSVTFIAGDDVVGATATLNDPASASTTVITNENTLTGVTPGTWILTVIENSTTLYTTSVTVTNNTTVSAGTAGTIEESVIIYAKADSAPELWAWTGSSSNPVNFFDSWTSKPTMNSASGYMNDATGWYMYDVTDAYGDSSEPISFILVTNGSQTDDIVSTKTATFWYDNGTYYDTDPTTAVEPVLPTITVSPSDESEISLTSNIQIALSNGNDTITNASVTITGDSFNSYDYSDFTSNTLTVPVSDITATSDKTISLSISVTNGVGTESCSITYTTSTPSSSELTGDFNQLSIYQVMVSSFQDGDSSIGYTTAYGPGPYGGDIQGIIDSLDYIDSLGMNAIWLTPIFNSNGSGQLDSTGYYTYDYFNVDPKFGTNDKFRELVEKCHEKNMYIILDGVFGHWGESIATSPSGNVPVRSNGQYNGCDYPESLAFYEEVAKYWISEYNIDGWRLDQCYQTGAYGDNTYTDGHNYWYEIRQAVEYASEQNEAEGDTWGTLGYMVGECWQSDASAIQGMVVAGDGLRSCFDFPGRYNMVQTFAQSESGSSGESLGDALSYIYKTGSEKGYYHSDGYYPNLFITNHDVLRFGNLINWNEGIDTSSSRYWGLHKVALASLIAYTGPVTVYYGDEWGAYVDGYYADGDNGWYNDNVARSEGKISGFNSNEEGLHDFVQSMLQARAENDAIWNGSNQTLVAENSFYVSKKTADDETVYVIINSGSSSRSYNVGSAGTNLISGDATSSTVSVDGYDAMYIKIN